MLRNILSSAHAVAFMFAMIAPGRDSAPAVSIAGTCMFGKITQANRTITISGGDHWEASGRITAAGLVEVQWIDLGSGRIAHGVYRIVDDDLRGHWGWDGDCQIIDGDVCGEIMSESIRINREK